jgi:hypothetical protein
MTTATCLAALVLLIDTSGSVPNHLYAAQRDGTASAFETPQLVRAMGQDGIAVMVADFDSSALVRLGWTVIKNATEASRFAAAFRALERSGRTNNTAIGRAIADAHRELAAAPCLPQFRLIDISTDGQETIARIPAREARDAAAADGIIINAIAFGPSSGEFAGLDSTSLLTETEAWLRENVVTGFVRAAVEESEFLEAFRNKLVFELTALHSAVE